MSLMIADGFFNLCYQAKLLKKEKVLSKLKYQNAIACCITLT